VHYVLGVDKELVTVNDTRLRMRLEQAGYRADVVARMERPELLPAWADVLATETEMSAAVEEPGKAEQAEEEHVEVVGVEAERRRSLEERRLNV